VSCLHKQQVILLCFIEKFNKIAVVFHAKEDLNCNTGGGGGDGKGYTVE
jgi:hypothetical protein